MPEKKPTGLVGQLLKQAGPMIEERIGTLKTEAEEQFKEVNVKLDKIIALLEK